MINEVFLVRSTAASDKPFFQISDGYRACTVNGQVVGLDIDSGDYFQLNADESRHFLALTEAKRGSVDIALKSSAIQALIAKEVLIAPQSGPRPTPMPRFLAEYMVLLPSEAPPLTARAIVKCIIAWAQARLAIKIFPFRGLLQHVERLRQSQRLPAQTLREVLDQYSRVSPLLSSKRDKCFFDSLHLITYLAKSGYYPSWVFGVRVDPFEAHCWVELNNELCYDHLERVGRFTVLAIF